MMQRWRAARVMATYIIRTFLHIQRDSPADRVFRLKPPQRHLCAGPLPDHPFETCSEHGCQCCPTACTAETQSDTAALCSNEWFRQAQRLASLSSRSRLKSLTGRLASAESHAASPAGVGNDSGRAVKQLEADGDSLSACAHHWLAAATALQFCKKSSSRSSAAAGPTAPQLRAPYSNSPRSAMRLVSSRS